MPIKTRCENCNQKLSIPSKKAGKEVTCPACKNRFVVPVPEAETVPAVAEEPQVDPAIMAAAAMMDEPPADDPEPSHSPWDDEDEFDEDADEGFQLNRAKADVEEMDLTPMVDVTFLLLIFFMITASFSLQKVLDMPTPEDNQSAAQTVQIEDVQDTSILVDLNADDTITIDDENYVGDIADLPSFFGLKIVNEQKNELILTAHAQSTIDMKVRIVDAARKAGVQKVLINIGGSSE